jgi:hypothetical protein
MSKLAIFVEGLTEQLFVERLIREIAGNYHVRIGIEQVSGRKGDRRIRLFSEQPDLGQPGYVLIRNCNGDHNVAPDVRDQYNSLASSGYSGIIGLRDLYPRPRQDLPILLGLDRRSLNFGLKTTPIRVQWIFAVMETEAWFLAEYTHFARIHPDLTIESIRANLGFDPQVDDMELCAHPADDLNAAYGLAGLTYQKSVQDLARTITALDFALIYFNMAQVLQLRSLVNAIDSFVAGLSRPSR